MRKFNPEIFLAFLINLFIKVQQVNKFLTSLSEKSASSFLLLQTRACLSFKIFAFFHLFSSLRCAHKLTSFFVLDLHTSKANQTNSQQTLRLHLELLAVLNGNFKDFYLRFYRNCRIFSCLLAAQSLNVIISISCKFHG